MSYILEALKKSKQERSSEKVPDVHIVHRLPSRKSSLSAKKMFVMLTAFGGVLLAILIVYRLIPLISFEQETIITKDNSSNISIRKLETRAHLSDFKNEARVVVENSLPITASKQNEAEKPKVVKLGSTTVKKIVLGPSGTPISEDTRAILEMKYRKDLPVEVQNGLPQLVFAGHTYADDPGRRMIIVNNNILREGDSIDANTKLLHIIWEGVVLDYKGMVFKQRTH